MMGANQVFYCVKVQYFSINLLSCPSLIAALAKKLNTGSATFCTPVILELLR